MDDSTTVEPFGFFTLEALGAGWYLTWRLLVRVALGAAVAGAIGGLLHVLFRSDAALAIVRLGVAAATIWAIVLIPRITIQWAEQWYGATLTGRLRIWWSVVWRVCVVAFIGAVICTPPEFVALSLMTAFPNSPLGLVGGLLSVALGVVNFGVTVVAAGWAMSRVAVEQIDSGVAEAPLPIEPGVLGASSLDPVPLERVHAPVPEPPPLVPTAPAVAAAPVAAAPLGPTSPAVAAPPARASSVAAARPAAEAPARPAAVPDRPQCPKCSLYETERGTVIGWYCKVCGWREGKSR